MMTKLSQSPREVAVMRLHQGGERLSGLVEEIYGGDESTQGLHFRSDDERHPDLGQCRHDERGHAHGRLFRKRSAAKSRTSVSAAMTNEDTHTEGFSESGQQQGQEPRERTDSEYRAFD
ncbi:hypothetical protein RHSIM_Rhsim09G0192400 [Rhododendron simsii]|uniref:Uncharacterized protein n=1 Tax=Rhododendron simsii TaxID=118357 RepID=A0A834GDN2_RHOSS|nr:hypothetical protein RHSIM_Rhsim09G0192400 [Rhododendron simsii]